MPDLLTLDQLKQLPAGTTVEVLWPGHAEPDLCELRHDAGAGPRAWRQGRCLGSLAEVGANGTLVWLPAAPVKPPKRLGG